MIWSAMMLESPAGLMRQHERRKVAPADAALITGGDRKLISERHSIDVAVGATVEIGFGSTAMLHFEIYYEPVMNKRHRA